MHTTDTTAVSRRTLGLGATLALALALIAVPRPAQALPSQVTARDNTFNPKEVHIDPGDTVTWTNQGSRVHDVNDDDGGFRSGDLEPGEAFTQSFPDEGWYFYFCRFHGAKGRVGMSGIVVVGDVPPPPELEQQKVQRPRLVVPRDFPTIQSAVDAAKPGSAVVIQPGTYYESVVVQTPRLVIQGVDRFRTILHGEDERSNGITVDGVSNVTVRNLTVRNYTGNGVYFNNATDYVVNRVDAIKGRTYGIYAFNSYNGVFRNSLAWGSGDGAFYVGQCLGCGTLLENLRGEYSLLGYSGTNATGVVIRDSLWRNNGVGLAPNTLATEALGPNRGTIITDNVIVNNNYDGVPPAGFSETGTVHGTGIWLAGTTNNIVVRNRIENHDYFGVLVSEFISPDATPMNNQVISNYIRNSGSYDLAWDGTGADNCFSDNDIGGATGPPMIQLLFACENRPFVGVPYAPVIAAVAAQIADDQDREVSEPPEPNRPPCQRGRPGCNRH